MTTLTKRFSPIGLLVLAGLSVALWLTIEARAAPASTVPVNNYFGIILPGNPVNDDASSGPGGVCTLRDAISAVNASAGSTAHADGCQFGVVGSPVNDYVISLGLLDPSYIYTLDPALGELLTTANNLYIISDAIPIGTKAIIQANAAPNTATYRVLHNNGARVETTLVTIRHGKCIGGSTPCVGSNQRGGGIYNESGTVILDQSLVTANRGIRGGGIYNLGTLVVARSLITGNNLSFNGGGIFNNSGVVTVTNSTISNHAVTVDGGGIRLEGNSPKLTVDNNSVIRDNTAGLDGGGISVDILASFGVITVTNSTINNNLASGSASRGGGIYAGDTTVTVDNSTISNNRANSSSGNRGGGGIWTDGILTIQNGSNIISNTAVISGGGIFNGFLGQTTVTGSRILSNTASSGGGVYNTSPSTTGTNVTGSCIVGNSDIAFVNTQTQQQTATGNWWGVATGPNTAGADTTSGNIDTSGFLTIPPGGCPLVNQPEILVSGNGVEIADGDLTPGVVDGTDFGNVLVTGAALTRTFTISNTGTPGLTLDGTPKVALSGDTGDFTVTTQPSSPVNPSTTFTIRFDPTTTGSRTATVTIPNNDDDENPYNFTIQGNGNTSPEAEIEISGKNMVIVDGDATPAQVDATDFGQVPLGTFSVRQTYTIINNGNGPLTLSGNPKVVLSGATPDFTVDSQPSSPVAAGGGSTTFAILFLPTAVGTRTATVSLANNDSNENPYNFTIQGVGTEVEEPGIEIYLPVVLK